MKKIKKIELCHISCSICRCITIQFIQESWVYPFYVSFVGHDTKLYFRHHELVRKQNTNINFNVLVTERVAMKDWRKNRLALRVKKIRTNKFYGSGHITDDCKDMSIDWILRQVGDEYPTNVHGKPTVMIGYEKTSNGTVRIEYSNHVI